MSKVKGYLSPSGRTWFAGCHIEFKKLVSVKVRSLLTILFEYINWLSILYTAVCIKTYYSCKVLKIIFCFVLLLISTFCQPGTPPRIDGRTIDYSLLVSNQGDLPPVPFSFMNQRVAIKVWIYVLSINSIFFFCLSSYVLNSKIVFLTFVFIVINSMMWCSYLQNVSTETP